MLRLSETPLQSGSVFWATSRHLTVLLRDTGPVSDTLLPSGILCQVQNTSRLILPLFTVSNS